MILIRSEKNVDNSLLSEVREWNIPDMIPLMFHCYPVSRLHSCANLTCLPFPISRASSKNLTFLNMMRFPACSARFCFSFAFVAVVTGLLMSVLKTLSKQFPVFPVSAIPLAIFMFSISRFRSEAMFFFLGLHFYSFRFSIASFFPFFFFFYPTVNLLQRILRQFLDNNSVQGSAPLICVKTVVFQNHDRSLQQISEFVH